MFRRLLLVLMVGVLALGFGQAIADPPPPGANGNGNGNGQLKYKDKITPPEQKAAAEVFQQQFEAAVAEGLVTTTAVPEPGGVPHYFGPYPNWANSPLPRGTIASIVVTHK